MEQMSLSQVCNKYHFTRRVIQGYEKEGLIKHTGKNKYGYLMYDEEQVRKIAYIRYLQKNGLTLKEISAMFNNTDEIKLSKHVLEECNKAHEEIINKTKEIIEINNMIINLLTTLNNEEKIINLITEEIKNEKINKKNN